VNQIHYLCPSLNVEIGDPISTREQCGSCVHIWQWETKVSSLLSFSCVIKKTSSSSFRFFIFLFYFFGILVFLHDVFA
jgi:hypothetical protein